MWVLTIYLRASITRDDEDTLWKVIDNEVEDINAGQVAIAAAKIRSKKKMVMYSFSAYAIGSKLLIFSITAFSFEKVGHVM